MFVFISPTCLHHEIASDRSRVATIKWVIQVCGYSWWQAVHIECVVGSQCRVNVQSVFKAQTVSKWSLNTTLRVAEKTNCPPRPHSDEVPSRVAVVSHAPVVVPFSYILPTLPIQFINTLFPIRDLILGRRCTQHLTSDALSGHSLSLLLGGVPVNPRR